MDSDANNPTLLQEILEGTSFLQDSFYDLGKIFRERRGLAGQAWGVVEELKDNLTIYKHPVIHEPLHQVVDVYFGKDIDLVKAEILVFLGQCVLEHTHPNPHERKFRMDRPLNAEEVITDYLVDKAKRTAFIAEFCDATPNMTFHTIPEEKFIVWSAQHPSPTQEEMEDAFRVFTAMDKTINAYLTKRSHYDEYGHNNYYYQIDTMARCDLPIRAIVPDITRKEIKAIDITSIVYPDALPREKESEIAEHPPEIEKPRSFIQQILQCALGTRPSSSQRLR